MSSIKTKFLIDSNVGDTITRTVEVALNHVDDQDISAIAFRVTVDFPTPVDATIDTAGQPYGYFEFTVAKADTEIANGTYIIGIKAELASGKEYTIGAGHVLLRPKLVE